MIAQLFRLYRLSPYWLRNLIGKLTWPLRMLMQRQRSTISLGSYHMCLDFGDNASFKYYADRDKYETAEITLFLKSIANHPSAHVIDIGANYGAYTLAAAQLVRFCVGRTITAVEPDLRPHSALRRSIDINGFETFVRVHRCIVSDRTGQENLFLNARSSADNRTVAVTSAPINVRATDTVACTTIDQLLTESFIPLTSSFIIKMDIQGNEPRALKGMQKTLQTAESFILFFEHCPYLIESAQCDAAEYRQVLRELGADEIYKITQDDQLIKLENIEGLFASFDELEAQTEKNMQGPAADYIICRNMSLPSKAAVGRNNTP